MKTTALLVLMIGVVFAQSIIFPGPTAYAPAASCSLSYTTNLALWVKADTGLTCTSGCTGTNVVTAWADQSGNANNLTTSGSILTYAASDINSLPAVTFPGIGGGQFPGISSFSLTTPLNLANSTMFVVIKSTNPGFGGTLISGLSNSLGYVFNGSKFQGADSVFTANLINGTTANSTSYHQANLNVVSGTSQALRIDRAADGTATTSNAISVNSSTIGYNAQSGFNSCSGSSSACQSLVANVAEFLIYTASLSGGNITTVEDYLNCRYGL